jgi:hypothetical protein
MELTTSTEANKILEHNIRSSLTLEREAFKLLIPTINERIYDACGNHQNKTIVEVPTDLLTYVKNRLIIAGYKVEGVSTPRGSNAKMNVSW